MTITRQLRRWYYRNWNEFKLNVLSFCLALLMFAFIVVGLSL